MQPVRVAFAVVLALPDRHALLHFIDDVAAGVEGGATMRCAHPDPHGQIADREGADAVRAAGRQHVETRHRLGHDPFAFAFGQGAIGFIVQAIHRATGVVVEGFGDLNVPHAAAAKKAGVKLVISTDAHSTAGLDVMRCGVLQARRAGLEKEDIANTRTLAQLKKLMK